MKRVYVTIILLLCFSSLAFSQYSVQIFASKSEIAARNRLPGVPAKFDSLTYLYSMPPYYKVCVGFFPSSEAARAARDELRAIGFPGAFVFKETAPMKKPKKKSTKVPAYVAPVETTAAVPVVKEVIAPRKRASPILILILIIVIVGGAGWFFLKKKTEQRKLEEVERERKIKKLLGKEEDTDKEGKDSA